MYGPAEFDKYVIRGIFVLIFMYLVFPVLLGALGGHFFGLLGLIVGLLLGIVAPLFWYNWYLGRSVDKIYEQKAYKTSEEFTARARAIVYGEEI